MKLIRKRVIAISLVFFVFAIFGETVGTLRLANNLESRRGIFLCNNFVCDENTSELFAIPYVYSGVWKNLMFISYPYYCGWSGGEVGMINDLIFILTVPVKIVDLCVSFVLDTIILPYTIFKQVQEGYIIDPPYFAIANEYKSIIARQDDEKAIEYYEKGLKVYPKYFGIANYMETPFGYLNYVDGPLNDLAKLYEERKDYQKAIYYYEQFIDIRIMQKIKPNHIQLHQDILKKMYKQIENEEGSEEIQNIPIVPVEKKYDRRNPNENPTPRPGSSLNFSG